MCVSQERFEVGFGISGATLNPNFTDYMTPIKGGYLLTGRADKDFNDTYKSFIVSLITNEHGRLVSSKSFAPSKGRVDEFVAKLTPDKKLVIFLSLYDPQTKKYDGGYIFKSDLKGNIEWAKTIKSSKYLIIKPQLIGNDKEGNLLLVSTVRNAVISIDDKIEVIKLNKDGNLIWNTLVSANFHGGDYYIGRFISVQNDRILITGYRNCQECEGVLSPRLLQLNATSGKFISYKRFYGLPYENKSETIAEVYINGDSLYMNGTSHGMYIKASFNDTTTFTYADGYHSEYSFQYYLLQHKELLPFQRNSSFYGSDGSKTEYTFYFPEANHPYGYYLIKYDSLGRLCLKNDLPENDTTITKLPLKILNESHFVADDSIYLNNAKVYSFNSQVYDSLICRKDEESSRSNIIKQKALNNSLNKSSIKTYPNPSTSKLQLQFNCTKPQQTQILILNFAGQTMQSFSTNSVAGLNQLSLDVHSLSKGMYTIEIVGNEQIQYGKFIKD